MTLRVRRTRTPKSLELPQVSRLLARGGILVDTRGVWSAYRCQDARRIRAGVIAHTLAAWLETEGLACRMAGETARLGAGPNLRL